MIQKSTFWSVEIERHIGGKLNICLGKTKYSFEKPVNVAHSTKNCELKTFWFSDEKEALRFIDDYLQKYDEEKNLN